MVNAVNHKLTDFVPVVIAVTGLVALSYFGPCAQAEDEPAPAKAAPQAPEAPQAEVQPQRPALSAQDAKTSFDEVFGEQVRAAIRSRDKSDDIDLATQLLKVAQQGEEHPVLLQVVLDSAYRLGSTSSGGFSIAIDALKLLMEMNPDDKAKYFDQLVALRQRQYAILRGDEKVAAGEAWLDNLLDAANAEAEAEQWTSAISRYSQALSVAARIKSDRKPDVQAALNETRDRKRLEAKIEQLQKQVLDGTNASAAKIAAEQLLNIYIVELDDPAKANEYVFLTSDTTMQANVKLAMKELDALAEKEAEQLGKWYRSLAQTAAKEFKEQMYQRAKEYLLHFLALHGETDLRGKTTRDLILKSIETELAKIAKANEGKVKTTRVRKPRIGFLADKSMKPYGKGQNQGAFPVQTTDDPRGPFVGEGVFFHQKGDTSIFYEIQLPKRARQMYWKGAASSRMYIDFIDLRGNMLASYGPFTKGNTWSEQVVNVPPKAGTQFILRLRNGASTWYYVNTIKFK